MPSKIITKGVMSCVNEGDCLDVCMKSRKISKDSSSLRCLASNTVELFLRCRSDQNDSVDTTCEVRSDNKDGNESELASDTAVIQTSTSQIDLHQFDEGAEHVLDTSEFCIDMANLVAADFTGIYGFESGLSNSGYDSLLNAPQFSNIGDHGRSMSRIDSGNVCPSDGTSWNNDSSEINIYSTNVTELDTLIQGHEGALMSSAHEETDYNLFFNYTYFCDEAAVNSDTLWLGSDPQLEVHRHKSESFLDSEIAAALDSKIFDDLPSLLDFECATWLLSSPKNESSEKPVTLVLDLDETLVHTNASPCDGTDFSFGFEERVFYVQKRPFLHTFLEKVGELFQIIIFTAGTRKYADHILDTLDPRRRLTSRRAYRDSCVFSDKSYTKDLTVLGVDLAKLAIVDNTPSVFHEMQVNNGIPIKSWLGDPTDRELLSLLPFLETLASAEDVRPFIAEKFRSTVSP